MLYKKLKIAKIFQKIQ